MQESSELKCVMSSRAWGQLIGGIVLAIVGLVGALSGLHPAVTTLALIACVAGAITVVWPILTRRSMLRADAKGLTYRSWRGSQSISWNRLSSLQFRRAGGSYYATHMVVVNDMGRKHMQVPVPLFGRERLHEWTGTLPARSSGREDLLDD